MFQKTSFHALKTVRIIIIIINIEKTIFCRFNTGLMFHVCILGDLVYGKLFLKFGKQIRMNLS